MLTAHRVARSQLLERFLNASTFLQEAPDESQAIYEFLHALKKKRLEKIEKESDTSK